MVAGVVAAPAVAVIAPVKDVPPPKKTLILQRRSMLHLLCHQGVAIITFQVPIVMKIKSFLVMFKCLITLMERLTF